MSLNRRSCLAALLSPWMTTALRAQPVARTVRIGFLGLYPPQVPRLGGAGSIDRLARFGYIEGRNLVLDVEHTGGDASRLDVAAAALVRRKPDVILTLTVASALAAKRATSTIPIVANGTHGAVETGLVSNLRRPGGNVTGTETLAPELDAKRLQLFRQVVPGLKRLAVVTDDVDPGVPHHLRYIRAAGARLGVAVASTLEVGAPAGFDVVLAGAPTALDGVLMVTTFKTWIARQRIVDFATTRRLPSFCEFRALAAVGCLMSYGPTFDEINERTAAQIAKILDGTPPGELPFEQPTRFDLVINLKTARALGITVPQELLLRADAVIE